MKKKIIRGAFSLALLTVMVQTTLSFSNKENASNKVDSVTHSYHSGYPSKNILLPATTMDAASQSAGGFAPFDKLHAKHEYLFDKDYPLPGSFFSKGNTFKFSDDFLRSWSSNEWGSAGFSSGRNASQSEGNQHSPFSSRSTLASGGTPIGGNSSDKSYIEKEPSKKDDSHHPTDISVPANVPSGNLPQSNDQTKPSGLENIPEDKSSNPYTFEPVITDPSDNPGSTPENIIKEDDKNPGDIENISPDPLDPSCVIRPESCSVPGSSQPSNPQSEVKDINSDIVPTSPDNPSTPVPEPESLTLLLIGVLGLKLIRRIKK